MNDIFRLFPEQASENARDVDALYLFLASFTAFMALAIAATILYFAVRYRRRPGNNYDPHIRGSLRLEILWSVVLFGIAMFMFAWGARIYAAGRRAPADAMEIFVVGKQWMWKIQHPEGRQEINELHLPLGVPVKLTMISQDVIHDVFIPAFRMKQDVLPDRYSMEWFQPSRLGEYHLFCAEYCGTSHSRMRAKVIVMEPARYAEWLAGTSSEPARVAGERLFRKFACNTCHGVKAPTMAGLYGRQVQLQDDSRVLADEDYIRESIVNPGAKVTAGYPNNMPTFQGQIDEEQLIQLVAYIKSLADAANPPPALAEPHPSGEVK